MKASRQVSPDLQRWRARPSRVAPTFSATRWLRRLSTSTTISRRCSFNSSKPKRAQRRVASTAILRPAALLRTQ
jgi:hypothetical protein